MSTPSQSGPKKDPTAKSEAPASGSAQAGPSSSVPAPGTFARNKRGIPDLTSPEQAPLEKRNRLDHHATDLKLSVHDMQLVLEEERKEKHRAFRRDPPQAQAKGSHNPRPSVAPHVHPPTNHTPEQLRRGGTGVQSDDSPKPPGSRESLSTWSVSSWEYRDQPDQSLPCTSARQASPQPGHLEPIVM